MPSWKAFAVPVRHEAALLPVKGRCHHAKELRKHEVGAPTKSREAPVEASVRRESGPNMCEPECSPDIADEGDEPLGNGRSQHGVRKTQQARVRHPSGVTGTARSQGQSAERGRPSTMRVAPATCGTRATEAVRLSKESARFVVAMRAGNAAVSTGPCESVRVLKRGRMGDCREASHA